MLRNLVEDAFEKHENAKTQAEKVDITWSVIQEILQKRHGRFLVWDKNNGWYTTLTDTSQIREKVALYIRQFKKKLRAKINEQEVDSSTKDFEVQDGRKRKRSDADCMCWSKQGI